MTDLTDHAKNLLARALCGRSPTLPSAAWAALGTAGADATGVTGEPAGHGYARQRVSFTGKLHERLKARMGQYELSMPFEGN